MHVSAGNVRGTLEVSRTKYRTRVRAKSRSITRGRARLQTATKTMLKSITQCHARRATTKSRSHNQSHYTTPRPRHQSRDAEATAPITRCRGHGTNHTTPKSRHQSHETRGNGTTDHHTSPRPRHCSPTHVSAGNVRGTIDVSDV